MGSHVVGLDLKLEGNKLVASYIPPTEARRQYGKADIRLEMAALGAEDFMLFDGSLQSILKAINEAHLATATIAERRDGSVFVDVTPDQMDAYVQIQPAYGGNPVSLEKIKAAIAAAGITYGLNPKIIEKIETTAKAPMEYLIASGERPVPGIDGELALLIADTCERKPRCDDNGVCDLRDLGGVASVAQGTPLMRRIPPVPGKNGRTVRGAVVEAIQPKDVAFAHTLPGTCFAPDDPDLLVAAVAGQPVVVQGGVMIEPVLKLKDIGLKTGNISFDGNLNISGDVREGMIVRAVGDITIGGVVENAIVESSTGSIYVAGGILGRSEGPSQCSISAKENISCAFVEHATLAAGGDIIVAGDIIQSSLISGGMILAGSDEKKGRIIGGTCQARMRVKAQSLGSSSGAATRIYAGLDPVAVQRLQFVRARIDEKVACKEELEKRLEYLTSKKAPAENLSITQRMIDKATAELAELVGQKKRYQKQVEIVFPDAEVIAMRRAYSGVVVHTGDSKIKLEFDREGTVFRGGEEHPLTAAAA